MNQDVQLAREAFSFSAIFDGITNFFKSNDISDILEDTRSRLRDSTIPAVSIAIEETRNIDFSSSKSYQMTLHNIRRHYGNNTERQGLFEALGNVTLHAEKIINELIAMVSKYFPEKTDRNSITYPLAQIMALGETIDFLVVFVPKYIRYFMAYHLEEVGGIPANRTISKPQDEYIKKNMMNFYRAIDSLGKVDLKNLERMVRGIPEVAISEDGSEKKMFNQNRLDPTGALQRFTTTGNILYYIQMAWVDYQNYRYKLSKEELESIKIDIDYMNSVISSGTGDAYLEKQREKAHERMAKLEYEIDKYEKRALGTSY